MRRDASLGNFCGVKAVSISCRSSDYRVRLGEQ
jgi:hypothetical protein